MAFVSSRQLTRFGLAKSLTVPALLLLWLSAALSRADAFQTLDPGAPPHLTETVPVQIVLIGYEPDMLPEAPLRAALPTTNRPQLYVRSLFGIQEEVGVDYSYDYKIVYADDAYEDAFFGHLLSIGVPETEVTGFNESLHQFLYNEQQNNKVFIAGNIVIDATAVERWLVENPAPGVDSARNTLVLVNWWGRDDFTFHTYQRIGDRDPDTGSNGKDCECVTRLIAWGGTGAHDAETGFGRESRVWYHDLSAGPDGNTANWIVDRDLGFPPPGSYYLPPIWEYLIPGGFLPPSALAGDLAKIARYVAVDLIFTPAPTFPSYLNDHRLPEEIELDITVYDGTGGRQVVTPEYVQERVGVLLGRDVGVDAELTNWSGEPVKCFYFWTEDRLCRPEANRQVYNRPFANFFLSQAHSLDKWRDGSAEHEAGSFVYAPPTEEPIPSDGFTDDNWLDGTQSGTWVFSPPSFLDSGFGASHNVIHEYGHYFGLFHPHEGYDFEEARALKPTGADYFLWTGDEHNTVMNYLITNSDFSQFDIDNMRRWQAAASLRSANAIAAQVLASPNAAAGAAKLLEADAAFTAAQAAIAAHDYPAARDHAEVGYRRTRQAADAAAVEVVRTDDNWTVLPPGRRNGVLKKSGPAISDRPSERFRGEDQVPPEVLKRRRKADGTL